MTLTGTSQPLGTTTTMEGLYLDSAPDLWIADARGSYRYGPDSDGFYWGLSGTAAYPVYKIGCYNSFVWGDDVVMNDVMCDASGLNGVIQTRQSMHINFTLMAPFPITVLAKLLRWGTVTTTAGDSAKVGIGDTTGKNIYWRAYFSKIYDVESGDFVAATFHKCQFVDAVEVPTPFGEPWTFPIQVRAFADTSLPTAQRFATFVRVDPSAVT